MLRHLTILLLLGPSLCLAQTEIYPLPTSADIIRNKCLALHKEGKLDSVQIPIAFFEDYFHIIDSVKLFYTHVDTVKYSDGSYAIGQIILDPLMEFERIKLGEWTFYYPSGQIYSKGSYSIAAITECPFAGPSLFGYNFKIGPWRYWYENSVVMAEGIYQPTQVEIKNSCGSDTMYVSKVTANWMVFDKTGVNVNNGDSIISRINNSH